MAIHVGETLLKNNALLLPEVNELFHNRLQEVLLQCNINPSSDSGSMMHTPAWLSSQLSSILEPHMAYQCSVKSCGTVLYRYGGDLFYALNVALGQVRNLTKKTADNLSAENNLSETCRSLNMKFHANIKRMIEKDASSPHRIEDVDIESFIKDLDPDIWKAICFLTQPLSSTAKKGTDSSNHTRKIRRCFCVCILFFSTNSQCSFPMHTLIADAVETCSGSSRLQKLLNRLGVCASQDTHARYIQYRV